MENEYQIAPGVVIDDTAGLFAPKKSKTEIVERKKDLVQEPTEVKEEIKNPTVIEKNSNKKISVLNLCALITDKSNYVNHINKCIEALKSEDSSGMISCFSNGERFTLPVAASDLGSLLNTRLVEEEEQLAILLQKLVDYNK